MLEWFCCVEKVVMFCGGCTGVSISGTDHKRKLKISIQTYLTHINTIFEYYHASVILGNVNVLYLQDGNVLLQNRRNQTLLYTVAY